jgi:peroxiredoxin-like protein
MSNSYSFQVQTQWTEHHCGIVESADIARTINFSAPAEFGGEPGLWTPEHLFLAAVGTCYVSTFRAVAERSHLHFDRIAVAAEGTIEKLEGGFKFTQVRLKPEVWVETDADWVKIERLLEKAEKACLVSRSLACQVTVEPRLVVGEATAPSR